MIKYREKKIELNIKPPDIKGYVRPFYKYPDILGDI